MVLDSLQLTIFYVDNVKWIQLYVHNKTVFFMMWCFTLRSELSLMVVVATTKHVGM
jgi:hypothetical protein